MNKVDSVIRLELFSFINHEHADIHILFSMNLKILTIIISVIASTESNIPLFFIFFILFNLDLI